jgi:hypothetical protein
MKTSFCAQYMYVHCTLGHNHFDLFRELNSTKQQTIKKYVFKNLSRFLARFASKMAKNEEKMSYKIKYEYQKPKNFILISLLQ